MTEPSEAALRKAREALLEHHVYDMDGDEVVQWVARALDEFAAPDKRRLDWLDKRGGEHWEASDEYWLEAFCGSGTTLREAIDRAMEQEHDSD